ncbi:MFS transporter [Streptacidiphilus cavernicola]|uniref:MFS transporter n=1 Tax=Streptacidiphilus cavernicola TaxID=3342716 RepID=A0ABV6VVJ3_9ACTN
MITLLARFRSFPGSVRLLMVQQFTINTAFYMLMPYLAEHLAHGLGMAAWAVGLVLGVRNFSQQGMFLLGGTLADRLGYKRMIIAGCVLRTAGFALLGFTASLPALVAASAATGFAGALFNPAVRAYLATDAGERRVEAFALFNVFYQSGMLIGPLVGLALLAVDFRAVCLVAALLFAVLTVVQTRALPDRRQTRQGGAGLRGVLGDWRQVLANRPFVLFSLAMIGSYILTFQVYLALPLGAERAAPGHGNAVTMALFALSALVAAAGQLKVTAWARGRWSQQRSLVYGLVVLGAAFVPPLAANHVATSSSGLVHWAQAMVPLMACAALLALGTALVYPFEMDTIVALAGGRLVATYYGLYNTVSGVGITVGNIATGALWDAAARTGHPRLPWLVLTAVGVLCAASVAALVRGGQLQAPVPTASAAPA